MRTQKGLWNRVCIIFVISCFIGISTPFIAISNAQETVTYGKYEYTMYISGISGAFVGETTITEQAADENLTTWFGDYNVQTIVSKSDFHLEHDLGYIGLADDAAYYDSNSILRRSEVTYSIRLDGYQRMTYTATYEYGTPYINENSATLYDREYYMRYYDDGIFQESIYCRDMTTLGDDENITVPAGTYDCHCLITQSFEDGEYDGESYVWVDEEGILVKQTQYDDRDHLIGSIVLISRPSAGFALSSSTTTLAAFTVIGAIAVVGICYFVKRKPKPTHPRYSDIPIPI